MIYKDNLQDGLDTCNPLESSSACSFQMARMMQNLVDCVNTNILLRKLYDSSCALSKVFTVAAARSFGTSPVAAQRG